MKTRFLLWLMSTKLYRFFLKYILPQIQFFHATGPSYFIKQSLIDKMLPGDVLLTKSSFHLTNLLIGGRFSHAAIVIEKNKIAEMTAKGFDVVNVSEFSKHCTKISLLRLHPQDNEYSKKMAQYCMNFSDRSYDNKFSLNVEALYCSELVYQSDYEKRIKYDLTDLIGAGTLYISPDGLYDAVGLTPVFEWVDTY